MDLRHGKTEGMERSDDLFCVFRTDPDPDVEVAGCARVAVKSDGITSNYQVFNALGVQ
tara:strand:- start:572 stop:745 length:174 start_codon:yes stop_codon:yes gene_type:complete